MQNTGDMNENVIIQTIRTRIMDATYKAGEKLREKDLCDEFCVSRTPVREAFRLLQNEGVLVHLPNKGVQVATFGKEDLLNLQQVRSALECLSAKNAALHATKEDIEYLRKLNQEIQHFDFQDPQHTFDLDKEFHLYIARIGRNTYVEELLGNLMMRLQIARYIIPFKESRIQYTCKEHTDVIDALEENNPTIAGEYMWVHFYRSTASIEAKLNEYENKKKKKPRLKK